jgi:hypothetical protein
MCNQALGRALAAVLVAGVLGGGGGVLAVASPGGAGTHSATLYPIPVAGSGGLSSCPDAAGLQPFGASSEGAARREALRYGRVSLAADLAESDRSWQATVRARWAHSHGRPPSEAGEVVRRVSGASHNPYRAIVRRACGSRLLAKSLTVTVGPRAEAGKAPCSACARTIFMLDRRGRALIYYVH